jgi:hypothetical protein
MKYNKILSMFIFGFILCVNVVSGQIDDGNFKSKISKGFVLVKFTAPYQYANLDPELFEGVREHEGCVIFEVNHEDVKKVVKKLRIRNYPSSWLTSNITQPSCPQTPSNNSGSRFAY